MEYRRCVIIGASPDTEIAVLKREISSDDYVICADGGYDYAKEAGIVPQLIVGDFDSTILDKDVKCEVITLPTRKDDSDMMVCVKEGVKRKFKVFSLFGATGGRPDHTYANISALLYLAKNGCIGSIEDSKYRYLMLKKGTVKIRNESGKKFSIFPFGCPECRVTLKGFEYEIEMYLLNATLPIGVSNKVVSDEALVSVHYGTALVITEK